MFNDFVNKFAHCINAFHFRLENCYLTATHVEILAQFCENLPLQNVSLNGNPNDTQNHYMLLLPKITIFSLAFCKINPDGMRQIAEILINNRNHPLVHLNLASNCLFDDGMKYVAEILRINRNIISLNLADNKIRTDGLKYLLEPLNKFLLHNNERILRRKYKMEYYQKKVSFIAIRHIIEQLTPTIIKLPH